MSFSYANFPLLLCWFALLLCLISPIYADDTDPPVNSTLFPEMPQSFSVMVETNFIERNQSLYSFGYYDLANNRYRIETHTPSNANVFILLPSQNITYKTTVGSDNCTIGTYADTTVLDSDFFIFVQNMSFIYSGPSSARGILTDIWKSQYFGLDPTPDNSSRDIAFNLTYHFSQPSWNIRAGGTSEFRVPIKATIEGYLTSTDGNAKLAEISRQYNFMDFYYGTFDDSIFAEPLACVDGAPPTYSKQEAITAGGIVGVIVAGVIIFAAVLGRFIYLKRQQKRGVGIKKSIHRPPTVDDSML